MRNDSESDVDGNTQTPNQRKILQKTQKKRKPTENQKNTKSRKGQAGARFLHLAWQGGNRSRPLSVTPLKETLERLIKQNSHCSKGLLHLKRSCVSNLKIVYYFVNLRVTVLSAV